MIVIGFIFSFLFLGYITFVLTVGLFSLFALSGGELTRIERLILCIVYCIVAFLWYWLFQQVDISMNMS